MNPLHIIEGHISLLLKKQNMLPEDIKALGELRLEICKACDNVPVNGTEGPTGPGLINGRYCNKSKGGCGCDMHAKTLVIGASCPIKRW